MHAACLSRRWGTSMPLSNASYRDVAACQFLQRADTLFAVVHRAELVQIQKLGQLAGIHAVVMVSDFQQGILARIAGHHPGDVRLEQIVLPGGPGSFFKGHRQTAA